MADGPAPDVGLGHLGHVDRRLHPGGLLELLERVLEGQGVDDRGEHAHVVGLGAVHARAGAGHAPPDVAAADDDGDVDVEVAADLDDLLRPGRADDRAVDAVAGLAGEGLAGELQQERVQRRAERARVRSAIRRRCRPGRSGPASAPTRRGAAGSTSCRPGRSPARAAPAP